MITNSTHFHPHSQATGSTLPRREPARRRPGHRPTAVREAARVAIRRQLPVSVLVTLIAALTCGTAHAGPAAPAAAAAPAAPDVKAFSVPAGEMDVKIQRGDDAASALPVGRVPSLKEGDTILVRPSFAAPRRDLKWVMAYVPVPKSAFDKPAVKCYSISDDGNWKKFIPLPVPGGRRLILLFLPYRPGWRTGGDTIAELAEKDVRENWARFYSLANALSAAQQAPAMLHAAMASLASPARSQSPTAASADRVRQAAKVLGIPEPPKTSGLIAWRTWAADASARLKKAGSGKPNLLSSATSLLLPASATAYAGAVVAVASIVQGLMSTRVTYEYLPAMVLPADSPDNRYALGLWIDRMPELKSSKARTALVCAPLNEAADARFAIETTDPICIGAGNALVPLKQELMGPAICYGGTEWTLDVVGGPSGLGATLDPVEGGFIIDAEAVRAAVGDKKELKGIIRGKWGFDDVASAPFPFFLAGHRNWTIDAADRTRVIAGTQKVTLVARADGPVKVRKRSARGDDPNPCTWEQEQAGTTAVTLNLDLSKTAPGQTTVRIAQEGVETPDTITLQVYEPLPTVTGVELHAGDKWGVLTGQRLEQVKSVRVGDVLFASPVLVNDPPRVYVQRDQPISDEWAGKKLPVEVFLHDGRVLRLPGTVEVQLARPRVEVEQLAIVPAPGVPSTVGGMPVAGVGATVNLQLYATYPYAFTPEVTMELAVEEVPVPAKPAVQLGVGKGLTLEGDTVRATFKTDDVVGTRPGGRLLMRLRDGKAGCGDWQPLLLVVALPTIDRIVLAPPGKCRLVGTGIERITEVAVAEHGPFVRAEAAASPAANWRQYPLDAREARTLFLRVAGCLSTLQVSPPQRQAPQTWSLSDEDRLRLLKADGITVLLRAGDTRWVSRVWLEDQAKQTHPAAIKPTAGGLLATFNLAGAVPGPAVVRVEREALDAPESIEGLTLYEPPPLLGAIEMRAGEREARVAGERLHLVRSISIGGMEFSGARLSEDKKSVTLSAADPVPADWDGKLLPVAAVLADGRSLKQDARVAVQPPRPAARLVDVRTAEPADSPFRVDREKSVSDRGSLTLTLAPQAGYVFREPMLQVRGTPPMGAGQISRIPCRVGAANTVAGPFPVAGLWGRVEFRVVDGDAGDGVWVPLPRQVVRLPAIEKVTRSADNTFALVGRDLDLVTGVAAKEGDSPTALPEGVQPFDGRQRLVLPPLAYNVSADRKQCTLHLGLLDSKEPIEARFPFEEPEPPKPPEPPAPAPAPAPEPAPAPAPAGN